MLVSCPECARQVSDRAASCPQCGFPIAEEIARLASARTSDREGRTHAGEVDCPSCEARGFRTFATVDDAGRPMKAFTWCERCEHTGRIALARSARGWYAVTVAVLERFTAGEVDEGEHATFLGETAPGPHRYPNAGERDDAE